MTEKIGYFDELDYFTHEIIDALNDGKKITIKQIGSADVKNNPGLYVKVDPRNYKLSDIANIN